MQKDTFVTQVELITMLLLDLWDAQTQVGKQLLRPQHTLLQQLSKIQLPHL